MNRCRMILSMLMALSMVVAAEAAPKKVQPTNPAKVQEMVRAMQEGVTPELPGVVSSKQVPRPAAPIIAGEGQSYGHMSDMVDSFERQYRGPQAVMRTDNFLDGGTFSMSERWRNPLDLPACTLAFGSLDTFSYFAGMIPGDGYKVWVDPSLCAGCSPVYPFRVDSLCFQLVQDDGSPEDTVTIGIDIECAFGDPNDPCGGPGAERCFAIWNIAIPEDSLDTFLSIYNIWLPLDSCWRDGPFFAGLFFLGNTVTDTNFFKPTFRLDGGSAPVVPACNAWTNLSGTWTNWPDTWLDPDPGYPRLVVAGECNAANPGPIDPCPNLCTQSRIGAPLAFYDPTTTAIWQWYQAGANLTFPYDPEQLDFSMYWYAAGSLQDSVEVTIFYGCPRFNNVCCAPMDVLCAGSIYITRTSAGQNNLVPVSLDLSNFTCCLPSNFWVGAAITDAQAGDTLPSFLYSNRTVEAPTPPDCEQWLFSNGTYMHLPSGNLGWWDALLAGVCGACAGPVDTCAPPLNETLNCTGAVVVACNPAGVVLTGQTTIGGNDNVTEYCCTPWLEDGPEKVYQITVSNGANISADVSSTTADLDVFILSACNPGSCVAAGDSIATATNLTGGIYYIVVDGFNAAQGNYTLTVVCTQNCPNLGTCLADFQARGPGTGVTTDRYLDGEWDASTPNTMYWMYYPGTGTRQLIVRMNVTTCTYDTIAWTSVDASTCRGLAYDPRRGGQYWTSTITNFTNGTGRLYRVSSTGTVLNTYTTIAGVHAMRPSGLAFDPDNNHLWLLIRGGQATASGLDTAYCVNVTNDSSAAPVLIQGPHALQPLYQTPYAPVSCGGADYAPATNKLIFAAQGTPNDVVECFTDINPAYNGPPPGPGLSPSGVCVPTGNTLQGFGAVAVDNLGAGNLGRIYMTNFTGGNPPHPMNYYDAPCPLSVQRCDSVINLTAYRVGPNLQLSFTAPAGNASATYTAYVAPLYTNVLPPNAPWVPVGSVSGAANAPLTITHSAPFGSTPRMYRIIATCN